MVHPKSKQIGKSEVVNLGIDVSVVITLHAEGLIVYRTFRALKGAIDLARQHGLAVEVVAVLDRVSDPILRHTVKKWSAIFDGILSAHEVDFGALSLSRNYGIANSKGEFISILDGDDLYGENWLHSAYQVCSQDPRTIAHPEAFFSFPFEPFLRLLNQDELTYLDLMSHNKWPALLMAHRGIFTRIPYIKDDQTFAYQDWLWNCETAANGYRHVLAPRTIMAIRQKRQGKSLWQNSDALNKVVRPNSLFQKYFAMYYEAERKIIKGRKKKNPITGFVYDFITPWIKFFLDHLSLNHKAFYQNLILFKRAGFSSARKILKSKSYPDWICGELNKLSRMEPCLNNYAAAQVRSTPNTFSHFCAIDADMGKLVQANNASIYIADSLECNSMILTMLYYLHTIEGPSYLVTTERSQNPWKQFLPEDCTHVDIGNKNLFFEEKLRLFHRLLLETNTAYLHLFDSRLAFEMLNRFPGTFADCKVYTSIPEMGMAVSQGEITRKINIFDDILDCFTKISTNSFNLKKRFLKIYGLPDEHVAYHNYPFTPQLTSSALAFEGIAFRNGSEGVWADAELNILWIGKKKADCYKKLTRELSQDLSGRNIALKTRFWKCTGFIIGEAASGLRDLRSRIKPFGRRRSKNVTTYDIVVVEAASAPLLPVLIHCMGCGVPVLMPAVDVPEELTGTAPLWIAADLSDARKTSQTLLNVILDSNDFEKRNARSKQYVESRHAWMDFKKQVADFYGAAGD